MCIHVVVVVVVVVAVAVVGLSFQESVIICPGF